MSFGQRKQATVRQRKIIKHSQRPEREEPDVIVSTLNSATLRHIKARRAKGSDIKVAVTTGDELQLREIFEAFDFDKCGNVSLLDFEKALEYIRGSKHFKKLHKELDNLHTSFIEMDVDGDATVDYQEFTIGMTGTANGALDGFSPSDLKKLLTKFVEFAMITKRQRNIDHVNSMNRDESDVKRYELFLNCFDLHGSGHNDTENVLSVEAGGEVQPRPTSSGAPGQGPLIKPPSPGSPSQAMYQGSILDQMEDVANAIDDEDLRQRVAQERAALDESENARFEILRLPKIKKAVREMKTVVPKMFQMKESRKLHLKYQASRHAYTQIHGDIDWTKGKYRLAAPGQLSLIPKRITISKSEPLLKTNKG